MRLLLITLLIFVPISLFAAEGDFYPLVSIPNLQFSSGTTLVEYINALFSLVVSFAAMIAVLRIVTGGIKYMTSEAIGAKSDARETIQGAVFGLILLLGSWLILYTVNPQILDLSALRFENLQESDPAKKVSDVTRAQREEWERRARDFASGNSESFKSYGGDVYMGESVAVKDLTSIETGIYERECRNTPTSDGAGKKKFRRLYIGSCYNPSTKETTRPVGTACPISAPSTGGEWRFLCTDG